MSRAPGCLAALAAAMLAPSAARADDKPDPAAIEAGDANLEPLALREGLIFPLGLGGALSVGIGMDGATGQGGAGTLRLAHVANARSTIAVEIVGSALFFNVSGHLYRTDVTNFLVAGQYYLNAALWLRGGIGLGRYGGPELRMENFILRDRFRYAGPAGSAGAGVDLVRLKRFRASVEFCSTAMINRDGVLSSSGFLLGLSID
jgi:hypothetical protein